MTCKDLQRFRSAMRGSEPLALALCLIGRARTTLPRSSAPSRARAARQDQLQRWQLGRHHSRQGLTSQNHQQSLQPDTTDCRACPGFLRPLAERCLPRSLSSALIDERAPCAAEMSDQRTSETAAQLPWLQQAPKGWLHLAGTSQTPRILMKWKSPSICTAIQRCVLQT